MKNEKRLIDANDLMEEINTQRRASMGSFPTRYYVVGDVLNSIRNAPTIDAMEVVRCKDCASFEETWRTTGEATSKAYCGGYCYHWDYEQGMSPNQVYGDDFCSYGERKPNGDL